MVCFIWIDTVPPIGSDCTGGHIHFKHFCIMVWSLKLKFLRGRSDQWLLKCSTFNILSSSSNGAHLHFKQIHFISVLSPKLQLKVGGRSDQWLVRYSTFNNLRSSSNGGCLDFRQFLFWSGPLNSSLTFEEDMTRVCSDVPIKKQRVGWVCGWVARWVN